MSGERPDGAGHRVPPAAVPGATAAYRVRDSEATLRSADEAFRREFAAATPGTPVRAWWASNDLAAADRSGASVAAALADGEAVDVTVEAGPGGPDGTYRLRARPAADGGDPAGHLVAVGTGEDAAVEAERIARVVSHDLRNPLDVARTRLRAARETGDPEHFERLARAHDRMERIVEDVLTLARGGTALDVREGVAVGRIAADAWETVDTETATLSVDDDLPTVAADPDRVRRLFENLFRNSVEHGTAGAGGDRGATGDGRTNGTAGTREGAVAVAVEATPAGFAVVDDGAGIPGSDRDRVFDPGYSTGEAGTGLGLTIVERIATAHDWTVAVGESEAGGARFEFRTREADG